MASLTLGSGRRQSGSRMPTSRPKVAVSGDKTKSQRRRQSVTHHSSTGPLLPGPIPPPINTVAISANIAGGLSNGGFTRFGCDQGRRRSSCVNGGGGGRTPLLAAGTMGASADSRRSSSSLLKRSSGGGAPWPSVSEVSTDGQCFDPLLTNSHHHHPTTLLLQPDYAAAASKGTTAAAIASGVGDVKLVNGKKQLKVDLEVGHDHCPRHQSASDGTAKCFKAECNCFVTYLLLGMLGFVVFWSLLMLRIYLPEDYWKWSYIWS